MRRASIVDVEAPRASSGANARGCKLAWHASTVTVEASTVSVEASTVSVEASTVSVEASTVSVEASTVNVEPSTVELQPQNRGFCPISRISGQNGPGQPGLQMSSGCAACML